MQRTDSLEKTLMLAKIEGRRRRGQQEDETAGWHHRLDGHEFEHGLGVGGGHGSLACCSPWDHKEWDTAEHLNKNNTLAWRSLVGGSAIWDPHILVSLRLPEIMLAESLKTL